MLQSTLKEFGLLSKLLTLTTDNASDNDKLAQLMNDHIDKLVEGGELLYKKFFGLESFVRCLSHIINLIVKDAMYALKVGQHKDVYRVFEDIERKRSLGSINCIMKIRTLSMFVKKSPQRQKEWLKIVPEKQHKKYIETDVDRR